MQAFRGVVSRFLELPYALAQTLGELRQFFCAEQDQDDRQNQNDFAAADIE